MMMIVFYDVNTDSLNNFAVKNIVRYALLDIHDLELSGIAGFLSVAHSVFNRECMLELDFPPKQNSPHPQGKNLVAVCWSSRPAF